MTKTKVFMTLKRPPHDDISDGGEREEATVVGGRPGWDATAMPMASEEERAARCQ